jgi:DNA-directed RNA polymerase subunit N (RpoN/RPB10)
MRISEQRQVESQGANDGKSEALDKLKIFRYCCRRMFLGHEEKDIAIDYAVASQSY